MKLIGIIDIPAFKEMVLDQRSIIRNKNLSESHGNSSTSEDEKIELLREIRDLLAQLNNKSVS